jgi:hypothetical protein
MLRGLGSDILGVIVSKLSRDDVIFISAAFPSIFTDCHAVPEAVTKFPAGGLPVCAACFEDHCRRALKAWDRLARERGEKYARLDPRFVDHAKGSLTADLDDGTLDHAFCNHFVRCALELVMRYLFLEVADTAEESISSSDCFMCAHGDRWPETDRASLEDYAYEEAGSMFNEAFGYAAFERDSDWEQSSTYEDEMEYEAINAQYWHQTWEMSCKIMSGEVGHMSCQVCGDEYHDVDECEWGFGLAAMRDAFDARIKEADSARRAQAVRKRRPLRPRNLKRAPRAHECLRCLTAISPYSDLTHCRNCCRDPACQCYFKPTLKWSHSLNFLRPVGPVWDRSVPECID